MHIWIRQIVGELFNYIIERVKDSDLMVVQQ